MDIPAQIEVHVVSSACASVYYSAFACVRDDFPFLFGTRVH